MIELVYGIIMFLIFCLGIWIGYSYRKDYDERIKNCIRCKHLWMNCSGQYECLIDAESVCPRSGFVFKEID